MEKQICGDNRFEIIAKYKQALIDATNIESSYEEMAVLDNLLFRFWQMGWLDVKLPNQDKTMTSEKKIVQVNGLHYETDGIALLGHPIEFERMAKVYTDITEPKLSGIVDDVDLCDTIRAAYRDGMYEGYDFNHWISVEDELPPQWRAVLAYNGVSKYIACLCDDMVWRSHVENSFRKYPVTHWMPLPQPPKKGGEK